MSFWEAVWFVAKIWMAIAAIIVFAFVLIFNLPTTGVIGFIALLAFSACVGFALGK